jgi:hypothetical protein
MVVVVAIRLYSLIYRGCAWYWHHLTDVRERPHRDPFEHHGIVTATVAAESGGPVFSPASSVA